SVRPMPVFPAVPSTMTPPGLTSPFASASAMIASAARSLMEPPGFRNSALPRIVQPVSSEALRSRISGVLPMLSTMPLRMSIAKAESPIWGGDLQAAARRSLSASSRSTIRRPCDAGLARGAGCAGVDPGSDQLAQHRLAPGGGLAAGSRCPAPADERVVRHVLDDLGQAAAAVVRRILDLLADLTERAPLPGHREWREMPVRMAGHRGRV